MALEMILGPDTVTTDWTPCVYRDVIIDDTDESIFLIHPTEPHWALTNQTGQWLAQRFDGSISIKDATDELAKKYDLADLAPVLEDVRQFVEQLYEANLLENKPLPKNDSVQIFKEPHRLTLYITEECNLRCKHCFVVEGKMPAPKLSEGEVKSLISSHLDHHPGALIVFSGGEALLRDDCLEIVRHTAERTHQIILNTNGHLIDKAAAKNIANMGTVHVQISLDGADPEMHDFIRGKGSFDKVIRAIELFCEAGMAKRVRTATTLTRCSVNHVKEMIRRLDALGIYEMRFLTLNKLRAAETNWEHIVPDTQEMLDVYRFLLLEVPSMDPPLEAKIEGEFPGFVPFPAPNGHHWCPLGETTIVDSQGYTYVCPSLFTEEYRTGHVSDAPIDELQKGEKAAQLREQMLRRRYVIEDCVRCSWRNFCQGSCQAFSELRTGTTWATDEFCDFRRELYREHARRMASGRITDVKEGACNK